MGRWIACAAVVSLLAGCSSTMPTLDSTSGVRNDELARTCTTSTARPIADTAGAAVSGVAFIVGAVVLGAVVLDPPQNPGAGYVGAAGGALALVGGISTIAYASSSRYGYRSVRQCREERAKCPASDDGCLRSRR